MNIYLAASTERIHEEKDFFKKLLLILKDLGYENTNRYLDKIVLNKPDLDESKINLHKITKKRIKDSVLLICDISDPSITLGTLIEYAITDNIPVLCICDNRRKKDLPTILKYYDSSLFTLLLYDEDSIEIQLFNYFKNFKRSKIKLNVFISPEIDSYMKWYAKKHTSSKSDIVRDLLVEKMNQDEGYKNELSISSNKTDKEER